MEFDHKFNSDATKRLQHLKNTGKLNFIRWLSKYPSVGDIIRHNGHGTRSGWVGIVEKPIGTDRKYLTVRWLLCEDTKSLMYNQFNQRCLQGGVVQDYSRDWATTYLQSGKVNCFNIFEVLNIKKEENVSMKNYIVWSPTGKTNPSVRHYSEKEAIKVAEEMATKYGGEFYVAKLVSKSVRNNVVTTKL